MFIVVIGLHPLTCGGGGAQESDNIMMLGIQRSLSLPPPAASWVRGRGRLTFQTNVFMNNEF